MEYFSAQVQQKDVGGRLQVGQELLLYLGAPGAIPDLEEDLARLSKTVDALTGWVGSSNYRVSGGCAAWRGTPSPAGPLIPDVLGRPGGPPGGPGHLWTARRTLGPQTCPPPASLPLRKLAGAHLPTKTNFFHDCEQWQIQRFCDAV